MNSPYMGDFYCSQKYTHGVHDGLDLVGITHKEIHCVKSGTVVFAGWENINDKTQGFGQYVAIKENNTNNIWYYGHLSEIKVKYGQSVKITNIIGIEGTTGRSTGNHVHICVRVNGTKGCDMDVSAILGIPNVENGYKNPYNDGYEQTTTMNYDIPDTDFIKYIQEYLNKKYNAELVVDGICGPKTRAAIKKYLSI